MYPFTRQFLEYNNKNKNNKLGMLILDVKGNYYNQVKEYAKKYNLLDDLIVIELKSIKVNTKITKKGNIIFTNLGNEIFMLCC